MSNDKTTQPAQAESKLTGCNCRWDGETQVQWCELHAAHKEAIHDWAERAKEAEEKLAAPQPEATPQWQPIETAPKDGAEFLGWDASVGNIVMYWDALSSDGRWSDGVSRFNRKPTHWMPLPSAPSAQAEPTACPHTGQCHPGFCPCSDAKRQAEQKGGE